MTDFSIAVGDDEVKALLAPFLAQEFAPGDGEWLALVERQAEKWRRANRRRKRLGWLPGAGRGQGSVKSGYEDKWGGRTVVDILQPKAKNSAIAWRDLAAQADGRCLKRVHQLYLMRAIENIAPAQVLEVGCGTGLNLFVLAAQFPEIAFQGIELTAGGTAAVAAIAAMDEYPQALRDFSPRPPKDLTAHKRVKAQQASAAELPFGDGSFDLVFSSLALEQMEAVRHQALTEISRVAKRFAVMIEPFRDCNAEGMRRDRIQAHNYFSASVQDLEAYGLRPVYVATDLPAKIAMGVAVVVAEKT